MIDERREAQAAEYVVGALPADELRDFEQGLSSKLELQLFVKDLRESVEMLPFALPAVVPPNNAASAEYAPRLSPITRVRSARSASVSPRTCSSTRSVATSLPPAMTKSMKREFSSNRKSPDVSVPVVASLPSVPSRTETSGRFSWVPIHASR